MRSRTSARSGISSSDRAADVGIEVMPCRGEVRVRDARAALGDAFASYPYVDLLVLARDGGTPIACRVELVDLVSGPRTHRVFACPACQAAVRLLIARRGRLRCRACDRTRTRRQLERTRADWRRLGGIDEDAMLRLLSAPGASDEKRSRGACLAHQIAVGDARALQRIESELETFALDVFTIRTLRVLRDFYSGARAAEPLDGGGTPDDPSRRREVSTHRDVRGERR